MNVKSTKIVHLTKLANPRNVLTLALPQPVAHKPNVKLISILPFVFAVLVFKATL